MKQTSQAATHDMFAEHQHTTVYFRGVSIMDPAMFADVLDDVGLQVHGAGVEHLGQDSSGHMFRIHSSDVEALTQDGIVDFDQDDLVGVAEELMGDQNILVTQVTTGMKKVTTKTYRVHTHCKTLQATVDMAVETYEFEGLRAAPRSLSGADDTNVVVFGEYRKSL